MDASVAIMKNEDVFHDDLHRLRQELDEAWWNEAPLERIQELERQIQNERRKRRNPVNPSR